MDGGGAGAGGGRIERGWVVANGVRFRVADAGPAEGPLLICLHGFPECWWSWRHVLAQLSDRFRVVAPDLRGYGESEKPATGYDLETLASDVPAIARALGRDRCYLAGHDWGGLVAWEAAARYPDVVRRLVILNAPHPDQIAAILTSPRQLLRFWYIVVFAAPGLAEWYLAREGGRAIAGSFKHYAARKDRITKEDREVFRRAMLTPGAIEAGLRYYRRLLLGLPRMLLRPRARIEAPTLVLWGARDPALGAELTEGLRELVAGPLDVRVLGDVGHWTQQEAPDEVCAAMSSFLPISV